MNKVEKGKARAEKLTTVLDSSMSQDDNGLKRLIETGFIVCSWLYTAATRSKQKLVFVCNAELVWQVMDIGNSADNLQVGLSF